MENMARVILMVKVVMMIHMISQTTPQTMNPMEDSTRLTYSMLQNNQRRNRRLNDHKLNLENQGQPEEKSSLPDLKTMLPSTLGMKSWGM